VGKPEKSIALGIWDRKTALAWVAFCAVVALSPARTAAQAPPGALAPRPGAVIQKGPEQNTIHVKVEVVSAPVVVRDAKGEMVVNLDQNNFKIFDNGVEQKIDHFDMGGDPLSIVLLVETSKRVKALLPAIRKAGIVFTQSVLGDGGRGAVIAFGGGVAVAEPFTKDHDEIEKVIGKLDDDGNPGAALYDALAEAENLLHEEPINRRRVIVAMTESLDRGSSNKLGLILREAQLDNITIFTVGLSSTAAAMRAPDDNDPKRSNGTVGVPVIPGDPDSPITPGTGPGVQAPGVDFIALGAWAIQKGADVAHAHALEVATVATGGAHVPTFRDRSIEQALDRIGDELHAEYTLGYHPTSVPASGYHEIKVVVDRPKTTVRTRPGYYLPPDEN
jgi:VWFA-related protein